MQNTSKKSKVVLMIPYFGRIPDYFDLWLRTAEANSDYVFYLYSDLPFPVRENSNIKIKYMTFAQLQERIREKLGKRCVINEPYKLCDYKPVYGELFADDIAEFDFWGFCDIDLLFGKLNHFITQDMFEQYDKIYDHGHFCLMRNNPKINALYRAKYPNVLDLSYTSRTNYCCHFDENGTIAYAPEYDQEIRFYTDWRYYDVPYDNYRMMRDGMEVYALWNASGLKTYALDGTEMEEVMYIHLQKRKMHGIEAVSGNQIVVMRNEFLSETPDAHCEVDPKKEVAFLESGRERRKKEVIRNIRNGAVGFRMARKLYRWRVR